MGIETVTNRRPRAAAMYLCILLLTLAGCRSTFDRGAVATIHPLATDVALDVLRSGGNAVDAAVAAGLMLGVVDGHNSGIGGGCFILIRKADGTILAIDGRETAPAAATRDMYLRGGKASTQLSQTGPLAVAVPGALAAYADALDAAGTRSLAQLIEPSERTARAGFRITGNYARKIRDAAADIRNYPETARILLHPDGSPLREGDLLRQPDLADTYRGVAERGIDHFYRGQVARQIGQWMQSNGGIVTAEDFAGYRPIRRQPLVTQYRGYTIIGFPPPSSGGVHVAQILSMLERFDLAKLEEPDRITAVANAMNLAFADRAHWLGDPDFAKVPRGLIDPAYCRTLGQRIATDRAIDVESHSTPTGADGDLFSRERHTTHIAVADAAGNWVAITQTVNTTFGSKVIVPGTGVILNNEMDDFSAQPGVPNHFGLVGAEANAVAPGKRPLSSMSPTIVLKDGRPLLTVGAAGGPKIITQVVLTIIHVLDLGDSPVQAMRRPRFHHQWSPRKLWIENTFGPQTLAELRRRGFVLDPAKPVGATQLIVNQRGRLVPVTEPRSAGKAAGW